MDLFVGVVCALAAAAVYAVGIGLQTVEAREQERITALRFRLFWRLVHRPRWLLGTGLGLAGWIVQAYALTRAPLTVVQPLLGTSLVFLLLVAAFQLGEPVGRREIAAVGAIAAGVPLLALTSPDRSVGHTGGPLLWTSLAVLGAFTIAPFGLRGAARSASILVPIGAGVGYALDGLATKFASDAYSGRTWWTLAAWGVLMGVASGLATLKEMSALQSRPAAHVAPLVMALSSFIPVALAPVLVGEGWPSSAPRLAGLVLGLLATAAGIVALARAEPVGRVLEREASSGGSGTERIPRAASEEASASIARPT